MEIRIKRVYDPPAAEDGARVLVDRLWPRGQTKEKAALDAWLKDFAPSHELRREFHGQPEKWSEFVRAYRKELGDLKAVKAQLDALARDGRVTFLFAATDPERNNAAALKAILEKRGR